MSFAALRKQSKSSLEAMKAMMEKENNESGYVKDPRYWEFKAPDRATSTSAVIRFLPAPDGEVSPFVTLYRYGAGVPKFKGFYGERCRTTIGEKDPMNEYFFQVRGDGKSDVKKERAKPFARTKKYIANVLVIKDKAHPENNGKVFLFEFGNAIMNKINEAINPKEVEGIEEDLESLGVDSAKVEAFDPFNAWSGANFLLHIDPTAGFQRYSKSKFGACAPISEDDDEIEAIWNQCYSLTKEVEPSTFKSYDELKKKLDRFLEINDLEPHEVPEEGGKYVSKGEVKEEAATMRRPAPKTSYDEFEEDEEPELEEETPKPKAKQTEDKSKFLTDDEIENRPVKKEPAKAAKEEDEDDEFAAYRKLLED